jgi:phenylacetate-CoA ligase
LIYPENIKSALLGEKLDKFTTGKFIMETMTDKKLDQYLDLKVELKPDVKADEKLQKLFSEVIVTVLSAQNTEYRKLKASIGTRALPNVRLSEYGDETHFPRGNKHHWVPKGN